MHPIIKILIGAILLIGSIAYVYNNYDPLGIGVGAQRAFYTVINGLVPPFVALLGLFIVWLELDELKIERELKAESKKK